MFLIAFLLIFSFSLANCSDPSSAAAAASAPASILSLPEAEKMKYIRVIHQTISDLEKFLDKKYPGVEIIRYPNVFSQRPSHVPKLYHLSSHIGAGWYEILMGHAKIDHGLLFCTYNTDHQKSKEYGLITPWGTIVLFSQIDSAAAKKFGPEKFDNKLFSTLRQNLNIEFDLKDYFSMEDPHSSFIGTSRTMLEPYRICNTTFDVIISKKDGTQESKKANLDEIHTYFGRNNVRVTSVTESNAYGTDGKHTKLVIPTYYHIDLKEKTLPKTNFRYLGDSDDDTVKKTNQDFRDVMTKYKADLKIKDFLQTHKISHKKARIAPAGGAGGGSGEVTE